MLTTQSVIDADDNVVGPMSIGQHVWVDGVNETLGFWTVWRLDGFSNGQPVFTETCREPFKLTDFWTFADFVNGDFSEETLVDFVVDTIAERNALPNITDGDLVRVNDTDDDGTNKISIFEFDSTQIDPWILRFKQQCTIQFKTQNFFDASIGSNDLATISDEFPEGIAGRDQALRIILNTLRDSILTDLEENLLFYKMVKYVHTEQLLVDWVFKTTFIKMIGLNKSAQQTPILRPDTTDSLIEFIEEAKPFHTKLRDFVINQDFGLDIHETNVTDFDKPVYFDDSINDFRVLDPTDPDDAAILGDTENIQSDWFLNFQSNPNLIRQNSITLLFDRVSCEIGGGWDPVFGWDFGPNEDWDLGLDAVDERAAERILKFYLPQPLNEEDIEENKVDPFKNIQETKTIPSLISGCDFKGTIVNGGGMVIDINDIDTFLDGGPLANPGAPTNPEDIIVDGNLFIQPEFDSDHPEELSLSTVGESLSICTNTTAVSVEGDPITFDVGGGQADYDTGDSDLMLLLFQEDSATPLTNETTNFGNPAVNIMTNDGAATFQDSGQFNFGLTLPGSNNDDTSNSTFFQVNNDAGSFSQWNIFGSTGDRTVDFYLRINEPTGENRSICGQWQIGNFSWYLRKESNHTLTWRIAFGTGNESITSGGVPLVQDQFHHIALERTGTTYRLYIDGQVVGTRVDATGVDNAGNNTMVFGVADSSTYNAVPATFDVVRITDRALWAGASFTPPGTGTDITGENIFINLQEIIMSGSTAQSAVDDINNTISDVKASLLQDTSGDDFIRLVSANPITLAEGSGTALDELGFTPGIFSSTITIAFRQLLNNVEAREANNIRPLLSTSLSTDISATSTQLQVNRIFGFPEDRVVVIADGIQDTFTIANDVTRVTGDIGATYTNGEDIIINSIAVTLSTGTTVDDAVIDINAASIPNVSAINSSGALQIISPDPITLAEGSGTALADLGFGPGTILPPATISLRSDFLLVTVDGVEQIEGTDYNILSNVQIQFISVPPVESEIVATDGADIFVITDIGDILDVETVHYSRVDILSNSLIVKDQGGISGRGIDDTTPSSHPAGSRILVLDPTLPQIAEFDTFRVSDAGKTTLAQPLSLSDTTIELSSVAGLPKQRPSQQFMDKPGVIWVMGQTTISGETYEFSERIEYFRRDGTTLKHIRRGTGGTTASIPAIYDSNGQLVDDFRTLTDVEYPAGSTVFDLNDKQRIPGGYEWEPAEDGLIFSDSLRAKFLRKSPGSC